IEYPGLSPEDARILDYVKIPFKKSGNQLLDFILPRPLRAFRDSFAPKPDINHVPCVRCGDCIRICASRAMALEGEGKERRVVIDYRRCIRCFCCHEVCPVKAIDITKRRITGKNHGKTL
ncbi:MAG: 4Fe-4S dicluster domain-containing protein, partial [Treponema sp.]|nr:4Fe-4S dicluster domain-containing protein [Treponema sp.]